MLVILRKSSLIDFKFGESLGAYRIYVAASGRVCGPARARVFTPIFISQEGIYRLRSNLTYQWGLAKPSISLIMEFLTLQVRTQMTPQ